MPIAISGYLVVGPGSPLANNSAHVLIFRSDQLSALTGDLLAFLGVAVAVLIGFFATIYVNSRNTRHTGFDKVRQSTDELELISDELHIEADHESGTIKDEIKQFAVDTDTLIEQLNNIRPTWEGYTATPFIEALLVKYVELTTIHTIELPKEHNVSKLRQSAMRKIRSIPVGLLRIEEAAAGERMSSRMLGVFGSMAILVVFVLVFRLSSSIILGQQPSARTNLYVAIGLTSAAAAHFLAMIVVMVWWLLELKKIEKPWKEND
jgi:hypothetical protein